MRAGRSWGKNDDVFGVTKTRKLEIGPVVERTIEAIGANVVTFGVLSLVLAGIPALVMQIFTDPAQLGTPQGRARHVPRVRSPSSPASFFRPLWFMPR